MKNQKNIRGWVILVSSFVIVFIVMPYALWKGYSDEKNIEIRGKYGIGRVIEVSGFTKDQTRIEYYINEKKFIVVRDAPSLFRRNVGDSVSLIYDSIDFENVKINW
ncbi:MAG: hypothetical protein WCO54_07520 [Bacteroidota bacterium]